MIKVMIQLPRGRNLLDFFCFLFKPLTKHKVLYDRIEEWGWELMGKAKFHPLLLLSLLINAFAMGIFAYNNFIEKKTGYSVTFMILCLFFTVLIIYGLLSNNKDNRT